jgi:hypothetical protein
MTVLINGLPYESEAGERQSLLLRINHRFEHPTPQQGVEVESSPAITCRGMGWSKSKLKQRRHRRSLNQFHSSCTRARLVKKSACGMLLRSMRKQSCPHLKCCSCYTIAVY